MLLIPRRFPFHTAVFSAAFLFVLVLICPAQGLDEEALQKEQLSQREDLHIIQEKLAQFQNDIQAMQIEREKLKSDVVRLQSELATSTKELTRVEGLLHKVDQAREADRKAIIDEVSKEIARLSNKLSAASTPKTPPKVKAPPKVEVGVEHVVSKGETLPAIAEAYGVSKKAITDANKLAKPELKVGQKLFIPKKK